MGALTINGSAAVAGVERRKFLQSMAGLALLAPAIGAQAADVFVRVGSPGRPPAFSLEGSDGRTWRSSDLSGKVAVLNFWASWCPPCRRELPSLESLYNTVGSEGVVVLGVNSGEPSDTVAAFVAGFKPQLTFPLLLDKSGSVTRDWGIRALPTTYVLDRGGRMVLRALGGRDFRRPDALQDIRALAKKGA